MEEELNIIRADHETNPDRQLLAKWLNFLYKVNIAAVVLSLCGCVPYLSIAAAWLNRVVAICLIVAMVKLSPANERYRMVAVLEGATLVGGLLMIASSSSILSIAVSVVSLIAAYQQYLGHSELLQDLNPELSGKWRSLFGWEICVGLLSGIASVISVVIGVASGAEPALLVAVAVAIGVLLGVAVKVMYLVYLKKTIGYFAD